ncbi:signal peptidase I [Bacteroidia bacterium]|nr:signal peptidase I [Bacteroidia bacterium]
MKIVEKTKNIANILLWTVVLVLLANAVRLRIAGVCLIPTDSMENAIMAGDRIMVGKVRRGAIGRNDVIIFSHLDGSGVQLVKRCVGLPGDTVALREGIVYVNGEAIVVPPTVKASPSDHVSDFPLRSLGWTINNYGPVVAPAKGLSVLLDSVNVNLYRHVIGMEKVGDIQYSDTLIEHYTFKTDGYFVLGDHRNNSLDSRYWGFVPEDSIIGKALLVCFSRDVNQKRIRWERVGKIIH